MSVLKGYIEINASDDALSIKQMISRALESGFSRKTRLDEVLDYAIEFAFDRVLWKQNLDKNIRMSASKQGYFSTKKYKDSPKKAYISVFKHIALQDNSEFEPSDICDNPKLYETFALSVLQEIAQVAHELGIKCDFDVKSKGIVNVNYDRGLGDIYAIIEIRV